MYNSTLSYIFQDSSGLTLKYLWHQIVLLVCCCLIVGHYWTWREYHYLAWKLPGPICLPILRNIDLFIGKSTKDIVEIIFGTAQKLRRTFKLWLGDKLVVIVSKPENVELVLRSPHSFKKAFVYNMMKPFAGNGLFTNNDITTYKRSKRLIMSTFNQPTLDSYVATIAKNVTHFCKELEVFIGKGNFDIFPMAHHLTLKTTVETTFAMNDDTIDVDYIAEASTKLMHNTKRFFKPHLFNDFIFFNLTSEGRKIKVVAKKMAIYMAEMIKKKRNEVRAKKASGEFNIEDTRLKATTDLLVELAEQGTDITDKMIADEMTTLLFGASDSSSITTSFGLMLLGMYPDIQEKVYEELYDIFGNSDRLVEPSDLDKMTYLELVIKEILRLFPIAPFILRELTENLQLHDSILPKGCHALLSIINLHRDPEKWKDPLKFDPDRFLPENMAGMHPFSYIPFSAGVRSCPGFKYSNVAVKIILATILRRYKVSCPYKSPGDIAVGFQMFMAAVDGYIVAIEERVQLKS